ncbi:MAG TPA: FKBP-type peptidyl-prolyl cis-trans isomerase [Luteitalea sp.]|nr:FKBP-type peptidyl-prolyl cis-trans isomerase [Luteitalea sp.]
MTRRLLLLVLLGGIIACNGQASYTPEEATRAKTSIETVQMRDLTSGPGDVAEPGRRLRVHYSGWLFDPQADGRRGRAFDSSRTTGRPFEFVLGGGQVIPGWDRGIAGMKEGGRRELIVPSRLAYGASGQAPSIPPDATLVFEVELLDVR